MEEDIKQYKTIKIYQIYLPLRNMINQLLAILTSATSKCILKKYISITNICMSHIETLLQKMRSY